MKVFITRKLPEIAEEILRKKGFTVIVYKKDKPISRESLLRGAMNADGLITLLTDRIDKKVIDRLKKCKVIANYAVGYNNIDVENAKSKKIVVTNTPEILTDATADLTVALILACARRIPESEKFLRDGNYNGWKPKLLLGMEIKNKIVGILGAGRIGQETAKRLHGFGVKFIYCDKLKRKGFEQRYKAKKVSLNMLLKTSDIISVNLPLNDDTYHILNRDNLKLVKKSAIIVNTARGELIDEKVLIKMLKTNKLFSVGLDVYENEPKINSELLKLKNVVLLPHIGSATIEARSGMAELAAKNVINVLTGNDPITPV